MRDDVVQIDRLGARPVVVAAVEEYLRLERDEPASEFMIPDDVLNVFERTKAEYEKLAASHRKVREELVRAAIENSPDGEIVKMPESYPRWENYTSKYTEVNKEELIAKWKAAFANTLNAVGDGGFIPCDPDDDEADEPITVGGQE